MADRPHELPGGPVPSSSTVSSRMAAQRRQGTGPEMSLRRLLHAQGLRYRVGWPVPGRPRRTVDVAFPGRRLAVFVDGCFWHACPEHGTSPHANSRWWSDKLARNVERDRETDALLEAAGWVVIRVWEHEAPSSAAARIRAVLQNR